MTTMLPPAGGGAPRSAHAAPAGTPAGNPAAGPAGGQAAATHALAGQPPYPAEDLITLLRSQIDAIDAGIARLVAERARLSHRVQLARLADGGVRVELGRERRIVQGYRDTLGDDGIALATAVLRLCRGPL